MKRKSFIYLASPYSHPELAIREHRFLDALDYTAEQSKKGEVIFSPIVNSHLLTQNHDLPSTWDFWCKIDYAFINQCLKVRVLKLEGWENSVGIKAELAYAESIGKKVEYVDY